MTRQEIVLAAPLVFETEPRPEDVRVLEDSLYRFNVEATGIDDGTLFGMFLRGPDGSVVGGVSGWTWAGTCHVNCSSSRKARVTRARART